MITKMTLPDLLQHRKCIAAQTRVEQIESLLDRLDEIDAGVILDVEWEQYILSAEKLMEDLVEILNERAKSYTIKAPKEHDTSIEAYLSGFDEFRGECLERYDADVIENITLEALISLYNGFLTALPDMEKAGGKR